MTKLEEWLFSVIISLILTVGFALIMWIETEGNFAKRNIILIFIACFIIGIFLLKFVMWITKESENGGNKL